MLGMLGPKRGFWENVDTAEAGMSAAEAEPEPSKGCTDAVFDSIGSGRLKIAMPAAPARITTRLMIHRISRRDRIFLRCLSAAICFAIASLAWLCLGINGSCRTGLGGRFSRSLLRDRRVAGIDGRDLNLLRRRFQDGLPHIVGAIGKTGELILHRYDIILWIVEVSMYVIAD